MARFFFEDADPIGRRVTDEYPTTRVTYEIIGRRARAEVLRQHRASDWALSRARRSSCAWPATRRDDANPQPRDDGSRQRLPVLSIRSVNEQIGLRLATERLKAQLSAVFGGLALGAGERGVLDELTCARRESSDSIVNDIPDWRS